MSASGQDKPRYQTFHGPGSVGGDNNGTINNNVLLDPRTAAVMEDLNRKAPKLAALLQKALSDGFISQDAVIALNSAVHHINEDTAQAFTYAAQHINEDTAASFQVVANVFTAASENLSSRVSEINAASEALGMVIEQINDRRTASAPAYQFQPSSSAAGITSRRSARSAANWWFISRLMCFCLGVGLLTTSILAHYHLEGKAQLIGVLAVAIPLIIWIAKAWQ